MRTSGNAKAHDSAARKSLGNFRISASLSSLSCKMASEKKAPSIRNMGTRCFRLCPFNRQVPYHWSFEPDSLWPALGVITVPLHSCQVGLQIENYRTIHI
ncbi:hypothetical protein ACN42_g9740 [Penicillium freii]|uniref:Uncharacterized protein n=1 Tax=Penicillium freii TaxID=48697 RepID=A0A117NLE3_PENFR|nr:hypothetical protein ACN42_g9740 [Penicillium freii]